MKSIGIARLKANLSAVLEKIKTGDQIIVTNRGRPVGRLVPLEPQEQRAGRRVDLIRRGLLLPGHGKVRKSLLVPPTGPKYGDGVLAALQAERDEGR
jgi:prevent-host-death family protein